MDANIYYELLSTKEKISLTDSFFSFSITRAEVGQTVGDQER